MALEEIDGVAGAFVSSSIEIFLSKDIELDKEKLNETLKPFNISVNNIAKSDKAAF